MFKAIHNYRDNGGIVTRGPEPDRAPYQQMLMEFTGHTSPGECAVRETVPHPQSPLSRRARIFKFV